MQFKDKPLDRLTSRERETLQLVSEIIEVVPHSLDRACFSNTGIRAIATQVYQEMRELDVDDDDDNVRFLRLRSKLSNAYRQHLEALAEYRHGVTPYSDPQYLNESLSMIERALDRHDRVEICSPNGRFKEGTECELRGDSAGFLTLRVNRSSGIIDIDLNWWGDSCYLNYGDVVMFLLGERFGARFETYYEGIATPTKGHQTRCANYQEATKRHRESLKGTDSESRWSIAIPSSYYEHDMGMAPLSYFRLIDLDRRSASEVVKLLVEAKVYLCMHDFDSTLMEKSNTMAIAEPPFFRRVMGGKAE